MSPRQNWSREHDNEHDLVATMPRFAHLSGPDGRPLREPLTSDYRRFSGDITATLQPCCFLDFRQVRRIHFGNRPGLSADPFPAVPGFPNYPPIALDRFHLQTGGKIIQGFSQSVDKSGQVIRLELDRLTGWIIGDRC